MADQDTAGTGAKDEGTKEEDQNPFAGFQTEQYKEGEREDAPKDEEQKKEPPAEQKKASAPGSAAKKEEQQDDEEEDEEDTGADEGAGKPKKPAHKRIGELTRLRRDAERRAETAERRLREIEARGADDDAERRDYKAAAGKKKEPAGEKDGAKEPAAEDYEFGELDSRYIRALARWEADQRFSELEAKREEKQQQDRVTAQQRAAQEKFQTRIEEGAEKYDDFHEKVVLGAEEGTWPLSQVLGELVVESDVGADIAYHLATNPDEAATVYRQSPLEQARYFGKMEAKFSAKPAAASEKEPAKPKTPKAPAPVDTPRGRGGKFQATADTDDFAAFERVAQESQ